MSKLFAFIGLLSVADMSPGGAQGPIPPSPTILVERPLPAMLVAARAAASSRFGCDPRFAPKDAGKLLLGVNERLPLFDQRSENFGVRSSGSDKMQYAVMIDCRGRRRCGSFSLHIGRASDDPAITAVDAFRIFGTSYYHDVDLNIPTMHAPVVSAGSLGDVRFRLSSHSRLAGPTCPKTVRASFDGYNNLFSITIVSGE